MRVNKIMGMVLINSVLFAYTEKWVYRYNGPASQYDAANQVVYGQDDNIYAAGYRWDTQYFMQFTVISLDTLGNERWVYVPQSFPNGGAKSIVYGDDGNIYVAGFTFTNGQDFAVVSLDTLGNERWVYTYNGVGNSYDLANSVTYGLDGNIYAAGQVRSDSGSNDIFVISLDTLGDDRWAYFYHQSGLGTYGSALSVIYGGDGNIYVTGAVVIPYVTWADLIVISLDTLGNERWVYKYITNSNDIGNSIINGQDGNLYVAGYSSEYYVKDFTIISLDTLGNERWVYKYDNFSQDDAASSILYGLDGNIYAAGYSDSSYSNRDIITISLTKDGNQRWIYKYDLQGLTDSATSIAYDSYNRIYVSGKVTSNDNYDFTVISLDTLGNQKWVYIYDGSANQDDEAYSIALGEVGEEKSGNIYTCGYSTGSWSGQDFVVINLEDVFDIREKNFGKNLCEVKPFPSILKKGSEFNVRADRGKIEIFDITGSKIYAGSLKNSFFVVGEKILNKNGIFYLFFEKNKKLVPLKKIIFLK